MAAFIGSFLTLVGLYSLSFYLYDVLKAPLIQFFYLIKRWLGYDDINIKDKYGEWAAITGASDGIGKEYARELAAHGINIILISRNVEKLNIVANEIECEFLVNTKVIAVDFSKNKEACKLVEDQLDPLPVRILVNNVGQNTAELGPLAAFTDEELWNLIFTNIGAVTQLSRYFIKRLYKANQTGIVVNVSSGIANVPLPNNAIYAATKAYTHNLTLALQEEVREYGINVQLLSPHFVATKLIKYGRQFKYSNLFLPNAATFARAAVNRLGKIAETTGYYRHDLEYAILKACPWRLAKFITIYFSKIAASKMEVRNL